MSHSYSFPLIIQLTLNKEKNISLILINKHIRLPLLLLGRVRSRFIFPGILDISTHEPPVNNFRALIFNFKCFRYSTHSLHAHQVSCLDSYSPLRAVLPPKDSSPICATVTFPEHRSHHVPSLLKHFCSVPMTY